MKHAAKNIRIMMVPIDPGTFRLPQPKDHFKVELTDDARQYVITNDGYEHDTANTVTFKVSGTGVRLASCTCQDFVGIKVHGRQCKHIHVAYKFHTARMAARRTSTQPTQPTPVERFTPPYAVFDARHDMIQL